MKLPTVALLVLLAGVAVFLFSREPEASTSHDRRGPIENGATTSSTSRHSSHTTDKASPGKASGVTRQRKPDVKAIANRLVEAAPGLVYSQNWSLENENLNQGLDALEEISRCSSAEIRSIIAEVRDARALNEEARAVALASVLTLLARIDPRSTLEMRASMDDVFSGSREGIFRSSKLLEMIEQSDPSIAAEWKQRQKP